MIEKMSIMIKLHDTNNFLAVKMLNLIIFSVFLFYVLSSKMLSRGNTVWSDICIYNLKQCVSQMK